MAGNWKFTPTFLGGGVDVNTGSNAGPLYVELLGAVRAWSRGRELPLGPPRQRAVLAILATRANHTVTRDQLVDGLWGERPPASAANGVHTYVAGLRRVLDPDRHLREAGRVLIGGGSGYLLRLQPDQLDLEIFNGLMASARQSLRAGDLAATVEAFDRALALWRGIPLANSPGPFAEAERTRLAEVRLAAAEERAETMLRLGRHADVVADLLTLIREHPLRERLHALLMIALYRNGRQADALAVYAQIRRQLVDELALEPGAELQRLHRAILTACPTPELTGLSESGSAVDPAPTLDTVAQVEDGPPAPGTEGAHAPAPVPTTTRDVAPTPGVPANNMRPRRRLTVIALLVLAVISVSLILTRSTAATPRSGARTAFRAAPTGTGPPSGPMAPGDDSRFVADITIPDGTPVKVGQVFTKTWEIQNTGTVAWRDRYLQRQGVDDAPGLCTSPTTVPIATTQPGQHVRITVTFTAPIYPGSCRVDWKMTDAAGHLAFPNKQGLYVIVNVTE